MLYFIGAKHFTVNTIKSVGVHSALYVAHVLQCVPQIKDPALAEHHIEVQFLAQAFPKFQRQFIELSCFIPEIVGPDNGGIATRITAAKITLLDDSDIGNAVLFGKVVGRCEAMPTATDNNHVIDGLRAGAAPGSLPIFVIAQGIFEQAKPRIGSARHGPAPILK